MDCEGVTDRPDELGIEAGHPGAFVGPDGGEDEWSKRFDGHSDLDLLPAADSVQFIGRHGVDSVHGIENQAAALHQRKQRQQYDEKQRRLSPVRTDRRKRDRVMRQA